MVRKYLLRLVVGGLLLSQVVAQVPNEVQLGELKIRFSSHTRKEIEKKIRSLTSSKRSLAIKVARAKQYFPLIEEALRAEGVPIEIKYLVLQESALISDAVSPSNAVGFWQFKDFTAKEVGLRLDNQVDARMHIIASTRGAARYLKRNNFYFDNWIYALTAYYAGRGGAEKYVDEKYMGKKKMTLSKQNHWYVKTFLAHWLVFEKEMAKVSSQSPSTKLLAYYESEGQSLDKVARKFDVESKDIKIYNKWLRRGRTPKDESLPVIVPLKGPKAARILAKYKRKLKRAKDFPPSVVATATTSSSTRHEKQSVVSTQIAFVPISQQIKPHILHQVLINRINAIVAHKHDNLTTLAIKGGITTEELIQYNELKKGHKVKAGQIYYLKRKRSRAHIYFHTLEEEETLWDVAQLYGIKLSSLYRKNRIEEEEEHIKEGRILWLRKRRPRKYPIEYDELLKTATYLDSLATESSLNSTHISQEESPSVNSSTLRIHIVQEGESFYSIAKQYSLSVISILNWNNLKINDPIHPGDKIRVYSDKVPDIEKLTSQFATSVKEKLLNHVVESGETLSTIAKQYGLSLQQLLEWNDIEINSRIRPGDKLRLSPTEKRPSSKSSPKTHIVAVGDTLYSISNRYNISIRLLKKMEQQE